MNIYANPQTSMKIGEHILRLVFKLHEHIIWNRLSADRQTTPDKEPTVIPDRKPMKYVKQIHSNMKNT